MGVVDSSWLSLKISDPSNPSLGIKSGIFISVPKKIVALATERNRLKRLIREAARGGAGKSILKNRGYYFRVVKNPGKLALRDAKKEFESLPWPPKA